MIEKPLNEARVIGTGIYEGESYPVWIQEVTPTIVRVISKDKESGIEIPQTYSRFTGFREGYEIYQNVFKLDTRTIHENWMLGLDEKAKKNDAQRERRQVREIKEKKVGRPVQVIITEISSGDEIFNSTFTKPREARKTLRRYNLSVRDAEKTKPEKPGGKEIWKLKVLRKPSADS